jgi:nitrate reductase gamma subunit
MKPSLDLLLFAVLPYVAVAIAIVATFERYARHQSTVTSMSSQFLENRLHFWALVPFHAGILLVLLGHVVAFLIPSSVLAWNASLLRLLVLESLGLTGGLLAAGGLLATIVRRLRIAPLRRGTHAVDWVVYGVLALQLAGGVLIALVYPWGSSWFAAAAVPYLRSLVVLQPDVPLAAAMPVLAQLHIAGTWLLVALFGFSKLVHIIAVPNSYLWRAPQVVRWHPSGRKP